MLLRRLGLRLARILVGEALSISTGFSPLTRFSGLFEKVFLALCLCDSSKGTGKDAVSREAEFIGYGSCDLDTFCPFLKQFFGFESKWWL